MWGSTAGTVPQHAGMYGGGPGSQQPTNLKHDIFVGNLAFNTTEDQLHQAFSSEIGKVLNVRLVTDAETGKSRGFAFVEFEDPEHALSAIRNMKDYELNGRRLNVNFSNSSHLEALAGKLGMDLSQQTKRSTSTPAAASTGTNAVADALKNMSKAEMYDVVAKLKEIADRDADEARRIISGHPQLPEALLYLMSKLDMVKTPLATEAPAVLPTPQQQQAPVRAADPRAASRATDPRQAAAATATTAAATAAAAPPRVDPRQRVDPRAAARAPAASASAPPQMAAQQAPPQPSYGVPPPPPPPPQQQPTAGGVVSNLDPVMVQQVMSLTPQQIQQLPPDKQQSILQLRQQITGGSGM